jgi:putative flippase GtrA
LISHLIRYGKNKLAGNHFYRFGAVGSIGFIVDASAFTLLHAWWKAPHEARLGSFLIAVSATYLLNQSYTFQPRTKSRPLVYLAGQLVALSVNMTVFSLVILHPVWLPWQYYLGLVSGSIAAMFINYELSRRYVFH